MLILSEKVKSGLFVALALITLWLGFTSNLWDATDDAWFETHHGDDSAILASIIKSNKEGYWAYGGLTGFYQPIPEGQYHYSHHRDLYLQKKELSPHAEYVPYLSQSGLQALLYVAIDRLGFSKSTNLKLFASLSSALLALVLVLLIVQVKHYYGFWTAVVSIIMMAYSQWLTVFGQNLWWQIWAIILPFSVIFAYLRHHKLQIKGLVYWPIVFVTFGAFMVKCLFSGYELILPACLITFVPILLFSREESWDRKKTFKTVLSVGGGTALALFSSFGILIIQIAGAKGSFLAGINHLWNSFLKRSNVSTELIDPRYLDSEVIESQGASLTGVIETYLSGDAYNFNYLFSYSDHHGVLEISFIELLVVLFIFSLVPFFSVKYIGRLKNQRSKLITLGLTTWVSLLCPLSWFVVFKSHSYLHTNLDFIVWYIPFGLLASVFMASIVALIAGEIYDRFYVPHPLKASLYGLIIGGMTILGISHWTYLDNKMLAFINEKTIVNYTAEELTNWPGEINLLTTDYMNGMVIATTNDPMLFYSFEPKPSKSYRIILSVESEQNVVTQLFFKKKNEEYIQGNTINKDLVAGDNLLVFEIAGAQTDGNLRIDIANAPGSFRLNRLSILEY